MELFNILTKLFVVIYLAGTNIIYNTTSKDVSLIIVSSLAYIIIYMLFYLFKDKRVKVSIQTMELIFIVLAYRFVVPSFIVLMPIVFFELTYNLFSIFWQFVYIILTTLVIDTEIKKEYVLIGVLAITILYINYKAGERIEVLHDNNEELSTKLDRMIKKLEKESKYNEQIAYLSQLEERNRIAQNIHDSVGHSISGSLMQLEAVKLLLNDSDERVGKILQNVIEVLRNGHEDIRSTLRNLKPDKEEMGINRMKLLIDQFMLNYDIAVVLVHSGDLTRIPVSIWKITYDNVVEALTNTMRYSDANKVNIRMEVLNKMFKVEIRDNGKGETNITKGLGLRGMEERVQGVSGKVIFDGKEGFSIIMLFPL